MGTKNNRDYRFDNIKALLIILVVFAHLIEKNKALQPVYMFIYSFHMPLFLFITGYFAKFSRKTIVFRFGYMYVLFQTVYILFDKFVLGNDTSLQYTKPYWLLWYLVAILVYYLLIPAFSMNKLKDTRTKKTAIVLFLFLIALLAGFDDTIGYAYSASRIIYFMPYFVLGYYSKTSFEINKLIEENKKLNTILTLIVLILISAFNVFSIDIGMSLGILKVKHFYGACSYEAGDYNIFLRLIIMLTALVWIYVIVMAIPDKKCFIVTDIGKYTLPVYLLHGFVVKYIWKFTADNGITITWQIALVISVIIVLAFGNKAVNKVFNWIFTGKWLEKIIFKK